MPEHNQLIEYLSQLQSALQANALWDITTPNEHAFASTAPFAADSMPLEAWLKWIFIPRIQAIIEADGALPQNCAISPYAELQWSNNNPAYKHINSPSLIAILQQIDQYISQQ